MLVTALVAALAWAILPAAIATAGQSATGELAFSPCDQCHPVYLDAAGNPTKPLPVGMKKHEIVLEAHDVLGTDDQACLRCHSAPTDNPGMLKLPDGSRVDINGAPAELSRVCQTCHEEKYREWTEGAHGKSMPKCTAAGCHDAHTPSWIYLPALPPFQGTGVEMKAVGATTRQPFKPLAPPPLPPVVLTPGWLVVVVVLGAAAILGLVGYLVAGRAKR